MTKWSAIGPFLGGVLFPVVMMVTIDNERGRLYHGIEAAAFSLACLAILICGRR